MEAMRNRVLEIWGRQAGQMMAEDTILLSLVVVGSVLMLTLLALAFSAANVLS